MNAYVKRPIRCMYLLAYMGARLSDVDWVACTVAVAGVLTGICILLTVK